MGGKRESGGDATRATICTSNFKNINIRASAIPRGPRKRMDLDGLKQGSEGTPGGGVVANANKNSICGLISKVVQVSLCFVHILRNIFENPRLKKNKNSCVCQKPQNLKINKRTIFNSKIVLNPFQMLI